MFSKYARTVPDKLTRYELWQMTEANRNAFDFFGWYVQYLFSISLFSLCLLVVWENGKQGSE